ncbi:MAG TPA: dTMP kinase [Candidatus Hydrogenedentes bacterium]|nr:dTMP kinase [Candidatus Hydrogenedentota bacterium]
MSGTFITFEGGEGSGKSTQIALLRAHLESQGYAVEVLREPGGTAIAEAIRTVLLDPANTTMSPVTELLLYEAARAQLVDERIRPALDAGKIVLCDRFADSTTAYQGAGRALAVETVLALHDVATRGVWPQLTIVLDLPVEEGMKRVANGGAPDRLEAESLDFHERVRQCFLRLAEQDPERVRIVDGTKAIKVVAGQIVALVEAVLEAL